MHDAAAVDVSALSVNLQSSKRWASLSLSVRKWASTIAAAGSEKVWMLEGNQLQVACVGSGNEYSSSMTIVDCSMQS